MTFKPSVLLFLQQPCSYFNEYRESTKCPAGFYMLIFQGFPPVTNVNERECFDCGVIVRRLEASVIVAVLELIVTFVSSSFGKLLLCTSGFPSS